MAKRVLVVEDDRHNSVYYNAVLAANGFVTEVVRDGANVLKRVREFRPDIITMDIKLAGKSGIDIMRDILKDETLRDIPILALTVLAGKDIEAEIREAGARAYVRKPVSIDRLLTEIRALLPA